MDGHPHRCSTDFEQILRRGEAVELDVRHPSGRRGEATESDVRRPSGTNPLRLTGNNTELYMEIFFYRRKKLTRRPYLPLSRHPRFFFYCLGARKLSRRPLRGQPNPRGQPRPPRSHRRSGAEELCVRHPGFLGSNFTLF
jgi:hypothetical protein